MAGSSFDVLCVGILVADFFAPPLPRLPNEGELLQVDDILLGTGGCVSNTAVDLARLGATVAVAGKVGNDAFAGFIARDLQEKGVDVSGIRVSSTAPTSRTLILPVIGQDRRYIHSAGSNAELSGDDVDLDLLARSKVLYVGGYQLLAGFHSGSLAALFRFCRERGIKTVLDVAGARADRGMSPFTEVLPYTDVFLPNDDEAATITGESDPVRQASAFLGCGAGAVVVTMGEKGFVACTQGRGLQAPAFTIDVVDPSGAGDAFDAGFILGLLEGWELERTLEFASAVGASACTRLGTSGGVFTRPEAEAFVAQQHLPMTALY